MYISILILYIVFMALTIVCSVRCSHHILFFFFYIYIKKGFWYFLIAYYIIIIITFLNRIPT